jgi:hypothetical protein
MKKNRFPPGWDEDKVRQLIRHYDEQTEEEAVAEDEAAFGNLLNGTVGSIFNCVMGGTPWEN